MKLNEAQRKEVAQILETLRTAGQRIKQLEILDDDSKMDLGIATGQVFEAVSALKNYLAPKPKAE
jgi:hypothetical protein